MINFIKKCFTFFTRSKSGICSICNHTFSDKNLTSVDELSLCQNDHLLYKTTQWYIYKVVESDPENPSKALLLVALKEKLHTKNIPSFILTSYREEQSSIISIFKLYIPNDKIEKVEELSNL